MHFMLYIYIHISFALFINSQNLNKNICNSKETCSECIQDGCIWCSKIEDSKPESTSFTRCIEESTRYSEWCPDNFVTIPKSNLTILKDSDLNSDTNKNDSIVQIRPQRIHLKLRLHEEQIINFQYSQAIDYPVDLYYLMDVSLSMEKVKDTVSKLGGKLAIAMQNLTSNFRLGFGTFIDKVVLPFTDRDAVNTAKYASPYSFLNNLPLNESAKLFTEKVKTAQLSSNVDHPEGGFDAILQSIVCEEQIGWRLNATRLLIFSTDASFHHAGDGKLVGVIEPHDGKCYLENGYYTQSLKFDYPSVALLNYYVKKHNIDLIFAVTEKVKNIYQQLLDRIDGSQLAILSSDTDEVKKLVMDKYKKLKQSVLITDNATSDIYIEYFSSCTERAEEKKTKECHDIRYNKPVNFKAIIKATSCGKKNHVIEIKPRSLSESLIVELELQCECDCKQPEHEEYEENSKHCSLNGTLSCGVCNCNSGRFGKFCECNENEGAITVDSCKMQNTTDELPCLGRGNCICGKCTCDKEYSGAYCQCDNFSCKRYNNKICSGNGICDCNQCKCNPGFSGSACECDTREESCMATGSQDICSGKGTCDCGECKCQTHPIRYWGRFCQTCSNCPGQRCSEFVDCVECQAFSKMGKNTTSDCSIYCANITVKSVDKVKKYTENEQVIESVDDNFKLCEHINDDECTILFKYTYDSKQQMTSIEVQKHKICPRKIDFLPIILLVSGTILIGGMIILVIWKIVTEVHDRHEYTRFEKERQSSKWNNDENPLYKGATTTVNNPMFNKRISVNC